MKRQHFSTNTPWEPLAGYSRALRVGPHVFVSGTTATDEAGELVAGDAYAQTVQILKNIGAALEGVGATLAHVVRTRIYVTDVNDWEAVARAHGEVFGSVRPTTTLVAVAGLIDPAMRVEIEVDALVAE